MTAQHSTGKAFVTFEGIEGSGKTTLMGRLAEHFKPLFAEVVSTREPGATAIGKSIRQILLDPQTKGLSDTAEMLLFAADRAQHVAEVIRPALNRNALVLCDRYTHSTIAYQGFARGMPRELLRSLNDAATGGLKPDLVVYIDVDAETGLRRASKRGNTSAPGSLEWNRFEEQELEFHRAVRNGYLAQAKEEADRFFVLDGRQSRDELFVQARQRLEEFLGVRK